MNIEPIQLAITVFAVVAILSPMLLWAYQAGRKTTSSGKTPRFDRVIADVHLNDTWWRAEFDAEVQSTPAEVLTLHLRQVGGRIFGEAHSTQGRTHSFEGLLHGRRLCYVALDDDRRNESPGAVMAEVQPGEIEMVGVRTRWHDSGASQSMQFRKAMFNRLNTPAIGSEQNVN